MKKTITHLLLLGLSVLMVACGDDSGRKIQGRDPANGHNAQAGTLNQTTSEIINSINSNYSHKISTIFTNGNDSALDQRVMDLLFPNGNATYQIQGVSNIAIHLDMPNVTNQQDLDQIRPNIQMYLQINDRLVTQGQPPAYVAFGKGRVSSANISGNTTTLIFSDSAGQVRLVLDGYNVSLYYTNNGQSEQSLGSTGI